MKSIDEIYEDLDFVQKRVEQETHETCGYDYHGDRDVLWFDISHYSITIFNVTKHLEKIQVFIEMLCEKYYTAVAESEY